MTPAEARSLSATDFTAFTLHMDRDLREQRRAARRRSQGKG